MKSKILYIEDIENLFKKNYYGFPFYLVLMFLLFDYIRPQSFLPGIGSYKIGIIIQFFLCLSLVFKSKVLNLKNTQTKCFIGLILLMTLHVPLAVNNYWAFQIWKTISLYFIVYLSIISFVDSYSKIKKFIHVWIIINLICAIVGLKNGGRIPNSSFMGDENDFALVMNMTIPFAYFMFLETDSMKKKIFYLSACCFFITANVSSISRSGFIGFIPVVLYCWYKTPKKILSTIIVAFLVGVLYLTAPATYWDEVKSIKEENIKTGTGESRWYAWKIAWRMFLDHPVIGVGPGNYPILVEDYQTQEELLYRQSYRRNMWGRAAHSLYFTVLPELGLIGSILFIGMIYFSFRDSKKLKIANFGDNSFYFQFNKFKFKYIVFGINGALLSFLVSGIFLSVFDYPHFWVLIAISTAVINKNKELIAKFQSKEFV